MHELFWSGLHVLHWLLDVLQPNLHAIAWQVPAGVQVWQLPEQSEALQQALFFTEHCPGTPLVQGMVPCWSQFAEQGSALQQARFFTEHAP
jgi:hypothetical protein